MYAHVHCPRIKSFKLIDDLLGEVQSLKEQVDGFSSTVGSVNNKVNSVSMLYYYTNWSVLCSVFLNVLCHTSH